MRWKGVFTVVENKEIFVLVSQACHMSIIKHFEEEKIKIKASWNAGRALTLNCVCTSLGEIPDIANIKLIHLISAFFIHS